MSTSRSRTAARSEASRPWTGVDIIAEPDRSSWRWKDEDEFALLIEREVIDTDVAARVREEADAVIGRIERDEPPFDSDWPRWKPDPSWAAPVLPSD